MCTDRVSKKQCSGKVTHEIHAAELKLTAAIQPLHAVETAWHTIVPVVLQDKPDLLIQNFLTKFSSMPMDKMSEDDILTSMNQLKGDLMSEGSSYPSIAALLSQH